MQSNFKLTVQKKNQDIIIKLFGVFDGASAFELIQAIDRKNNSGKKVYIDTSRLSQTFPFGQAVLEKHLSNNKSRSRLHFTGKWAMDILPEGCILLNGKQSQGHICNGDCKNCACRRQKLHPLPLS